MKKKLLSLVFGALCVGAVSAAVPASVSRAVRQVNAAPALDVECLLNGRAATLSLSGNCFKFDVGGAQVYFDGTTQWSYSPGDNEVTILTPTAAEIAEANPLSILRSLDSDYDGEALSGNPNTVRLTPRKQQGNVAEVAITFNPTTGWPTEMTIIMGGQRAELKNLKFTVDKTTRSGAYFQFNPPRGVVVTDLR